ncbi:MAG: hypothetical protein QXU20_04645 [Candidatus Woesearchaeota archaeon]
MNMLKDKDFVKVVWQETPNSVRVIQGYYFDEGEFVRVKGDYKEVLIKKDWIISIEKKLKNNKK